MSRSSLQIFVPFLLATLATSLLNAQDRAGVSTQYKTETDVLYRSGDDLSDTMKERCRLDVYYPTNKTDYATVVWFHGGGLTGGSKFIPDGLKNQGIAVVAANYRLSPAVQSPTYVEDAAAAVAWTIKNIESRGGSRHRVFVAGHSAGGYLTSMVGLDRKYLAAHDLNADDIAGLIPYSGHTITHFTVRKEQGIDGKQPIIDEMAPLYHVRPDAPPILLITGDREMEMLGRYEENAYLWRMLKVAGDEDVELFELDGFDHGQMANPAHALTIKFVRQIVNTHLDR
ncbi:acetyl esterase/lipase [Rhodopirellula rubra]|uniref:Acetyl esterase/lipase n=1 Tax=Aporhodopirellula rubra TaxID=980271 RepID=A0A7W5E2S8_9BACT|nr:alpha/beta hydrolase [Aporhodopirellula rubra]MBB3209146.1 acetyl esterase/lipase [Aporhodopirellula rubra]